VGKKGQENIKNTSAVSVISVLSFGVAKKITWDDITSVSLAG